MSLNFINFVFNWIKNNFKLNIFFRWERIKVPYQCNISEIYPILFNETLYLDTEKPNKQTQIPDSFLCGSIQKMVNNCKWYSLSVLI